MDISNEGIFIKAYTDHEKALLRRSYFKLSDKELADDVVQVTFLKMWQFIQQDKKVDSMKAFLFHILNNLIIDEYRKKKHISLDQIVDGGFQVSIDDSDRIFNTIDGKTAILLIPLLSEKYASVITMHYIENMTLKEISQATDQTKNTVAMQIHRGVEKLAVLFRIERS